MSKGSTRRPRLISRQEESLRWKLAMGEITLTEFYKTLKELKGRKNA